MRSQFIGRRRELAALERAWREPRAALIPVYGRRRVGKTELILHFCEGKPGIYYAATQGTRAYQVRTFLRAAAEQLGQSWLAEAATEDWQQALKLAGRVPRRGGHKGQVLVLDEFQWLCEAAPELPSLLQQRWDQEWQHDSRFMLILCGSYLGFMERAVLGSKSPLFGRRTGQILLEPFDYQEAGEFFPHWALEQRARAYFVCGGIPYYLKAIDPEQSLAQNVTSNFLNVDAPLFREPDFLLREELRDVGAYATVIEAIAEGRSRPAHMAAFAGMSSSQLPYFLNNLMSLGYVQRRLPLVPGRPSRKQTRYAITDPLLRFWFRFIAPNQSMIRAGSPERAYETLIKPSVEAFYGACFEQLCREALPRLYRAEGVIGKYAVGEFWSHDTQIDVVGLRVDGWTDLGECKWGRIRSLSATARELADKAVHYPLQGATLQKRLFLRRQVKANPPLGVRLHDLEGLYAARGFA